MANTDLPTIRITSNTPEPGETHEAFEPKQLQSLEGYEATEDTGSSSRLREGNRKSLFRNPFKNLFASKGKSKTATPLKPNAEDLTASQKKITAGKNNNNRLTRLKNALRKFFGLNRMRDRKIAKAKKKIEANQACSLRGALRKLEYRKNHREYKAKQQFLRETKSPMIQTFDQGMVELETLLGKIQKESMTDTSILSLEDQKQLREISILSLEDQKQLRESFQRIDFALFEDHFPDQPT